MDRPNSPVDQAKMDYQRRLQKATTLLSQLEIDAALSIFYGLLQDHPKDLALINRIYALEVKRPQLAGYRKICNHIFSISSSQHEYQELVLKVFTDYRQHRQDSPIANKAMLFNLLARLGESHFLDQVETLKNQIKKDYAEDPLTPPALQRYCEQLIERKQLIKAREELKYLIAYYAETEAGIWALKTKPIIEAEII